VDLADGVAAVEGVEVEAWGVLGEEGGTELGGDLDADLDDLGGLVGDGVEAIEERRGDDAAASPGFHGAQRFFRSRD